MPCRVVKCKCGHSFPDNPEKHRTREKYCPRCRAPYKKTWADWTFSDWWESHKSEQRRQREIEKALRRKPDESLPDADRGIFARLMSMMGADK